ncbi:MAG: CbtB-domain containing protein [Aromatoleum sp.]|jgi:cobalt transporter subunit CbtB|uniref:CbtB domain-containing protein n=1 Tax=Aromatoleum sp. TaxID=2307007 RepID=UPI002894644B|nr:CbtB-domain containing protein [Aromatoleum sp.]MDT3670408.1 CbtB-domain containing protein [Aromatoleum sp.]
MQQQATLHIARPKSVLLAIALPVVTAALLGAVIIHGVGFSHIAAAHNAAHDSRHANVFPCH